MRIVSINHKVKIVVNIIILLSLIVSNPLIVPAWSGKGHVIITRMAVKLLLDDPNVPTELKNILKEGLNGENKVNELKTYVISDDNERVFDHGLDSFSVRPDDLTATKSPVPAFNSTEPLMHYLDSELFQTDVSRQKFALDGSNKIKPSDLPRDPKDKRYQEAGFITFRTEQSYKNLVSSLKENYSNDQVFLWIGYLSHYLSDAYQPFHSTVDYQGHECLCNKALEKKHNFHPALEGLLFRDKSSLGQKNRAKYWEYFSNEVSKLNASEKAQPLDPYLVTQDALLSGYDYLPMLCRAADKAFKEQKLDANVWFNHQDKVNNQETTVLQLKAERMAQATIKLRFLILQAWQEANKKVP